MSAYVNRLYHAGVSCSADTPGPQVLEALAAEASRQVDRVLSPAEIRSTVMVGRCDDGCCVYLEAVGIAAVWEPDVPRLVL